MKHIPLEEELRREIPSFREGLRACAPPREDFDAEKWIYIPPCYGEYRYVLGTRGRKPLICIGVNPSTAAPDALDPTLQSVCRIAEANGYDSFLMFNLYAQRATDPERMEERFNLLLHENNLEAFRYVLSQCAPPADIWAAWGALIEERPYLTDCLEGFVDAAREYGARFVCFGQRSRAGHPHHPLYLRRDSVLQPFDAGAYLEDLRRRRAEKRTRSAVGRRKKEA